jgi:citrate lyase beta subunit
LTTPPRSLLFAAADERELLAAALASDADAVVADLEDSVAEERKAEARAIAGELFATPRKTGERFVRINVVGGPHVAADLAFVAGLQVDALVVPKATPDAIRALGDTGPPIVAVVESAIGLRLAFEIASLPRVRGLQLGANDLAEDLGLESRADAQELLFARSKLVLDAVAAGVAGIFDRVLRSSVADAVLEEDARFARALGFTGKSTLSLAHDEILRRVFTRAADV